MEVKRDGRVALVTGGSQGIGLAIANRMTASGADVASLRAGLTRWRRHGPPWARRRSSWMREGWQRTTALMAFALVTLAAPSARADAPMPAPAEVEVLSPRGTCLAMAKLHPARVVVQSLTQPQPEPWSLPFWNPILVVSDDCDMLGVGYDRGSLLVLDEKSPDTPVMTFYRREKVIRVIRLGDLYPDLEVLPRTASHWYWLASSSWSGKIWTVRTVDGRTLAFTP